MSEKGEELFSQETINRFTAFHNVRPSVCCGASRKVKQVNGATLAAFCSKCNTQQPLALAKKQTTKQ